MAEAEETEENNEESSPKKSSKLPLILGVVLALLGGGGGFFAVQSGLIGGSETQSAEAEADHSEGAEAPEALPQLTFVALDPMVITLPDTGRRVQLRFRAELEVAPEYAEDVELLKPRIIDVLNSYLRAVDIPTLEDPTALIRLRSQMLRRVQIVTGEGRVKDLLIMEFVMN